MSEPLACADMPYFHGRISRLEAEDILLKMGNQDGMFLLREDMTVFDNFTLSIVHNDGSHHYQIERMENGEVMIAQGRRFPGPVELLEYHAANQGGLITKPTYAVCRSLKNAPIVFRGISAADMERELEDKARQLELNTQQKLNALGAQRQQFMILVARDLHLKQPWYHHRIERDGAEIRLHDKDDGTFLVRSKGDRKYALSLQFEGNTKHYKIDLRGSDKYAIEQGPQFDSIIQMIDHYYNRPDGLLCRLSAPCVKPGMPPPPDNPSSSQDYFLTEHFTHADFTQAKQFAGGAAASSLGFFKNGIGTLKQRPPPPIPAGEADRRSLSLRRPAPNPPKVHKPAPPLPFDSVDVGATAAAASSATVENGASSACSSAAEDNQKIYDSLPICEDTFNLKREHLHLIEQLGKGCFGSVMKGVYVKGGKNIHVAVKTIKKGSSVDESAMMKEAKLMSKLRHRHIVRMIGLCKGETFMLVLELASLGPLHKYLKRHSEMTISKIIELVFQVARGMNYLESQNFIHRDLAARNVLLVNEEFAKISDFGMSKALGLDNNYYTEAQPGKWPIKWYAPECFYYYKFDSKSDVWSFGVTAWEALSYGKKPFPTMKGPQVLQHLESGKRLEMPDNCPRGMYDIMLRCWEIEKSKRPTFSELVDIIKRFKS